MELESIVNIVVQYGAIGAICAYLLYKDHTTAKRTNELLTIIATKLEELKL